MLIVLHKWYVKRQYIDLDVICITPNSSSETNTLILLMYLPKTQSSYITKIKAAY